MQKFASVVLIQEGQVNVAAEGEAVEEEIVWALSRKVIITYLP